MLIKTGAPVAFTNCIAIVTAVTWVLITAPGQSFWCPHTPVTWSHCGDLSLLLPMCGGNCWQFIFTPPKKKPPQNPLLFLMFSYLLHARFLSDRLFSLTAKHTVESHIQKPKCLPLSTDPSSPLLLCCFLFQETWRRVLFTWAPLLSLWRFLFHATW